MSVEQIVRCQPRFDRVVALIIKKVNEMGLYFDPHQPRVAQLAVAIAREMGLSEEKIKGLDMAASIHDFGKLGIPEHILHKPFQNTPSSLDQAEWDLIKTHPQIGYNILKSTDFPWPVAEIVRQHHEKWDGSGYPQGLSGEEILLEARILTVADVIESMSAVRPYRPREETPGLDEALETIEREAGVLYDSEVVDVCLRLFSEKGFEFENGEEGGL